MGYPKVSVIIPCRTKDDAAECVKKCLELDYPDFEVIVTPDYNVSHPDGKVKYICTGPEYPGIKRNIALKYAIGDVIAYIDSDAYPPPSWLTNAVPLLTIDSVVAVCGPGLLPPGVGWREKVSDYIYRMLPLNYRVRAKAARVVKEFPTFNLIVKREHVVDFKDYLTGEDTVFCAELKGLILYSPHVWVYHHRRKFLMPLLKQVSTFGLHRGHLVGLAVCGWVMTVLCYGYNFVKGLFRRKLY